ncbi:MAG: hypothetical protein AAF363_14980 [Bacteroidota bacterium]
MTNRLHYILFVLIPILGFGLFFSCSSDDTPGPLSDDVASNFALFITTDPATSAGLIIPFDSVPSGTIDPGSFTNARQVSQIREAGTGFGNSFYHVFNSAGDGGIQKFSLNADGSTRDEGFIFTGIFRMMFEIVNENEGYYWDGELGEKSLQTFNPETMQRTGAIDLSEEIDLFDNDEVESVRIGGFMVERERKLYTQVFYNDVNGIHVYDSAFFAVIDLDTQEIENFSIYPKFGTYGFDIKNLNMAHIAPNDALYISTFWGFVGDELNGRILRFNSGEINLDENFDINVNEFVGGGAFLVGGPIAVDDKLFVRLKANPTTPDFSNLEEEDIYLHEIDVNTGSITRIPGIPGSSFNSISGPFIINELVYSVVSNNTEQAYYTYNPQNEEVVKAITFTAGTPQHIVQFNVTE